MEVDAPRLDFIAPRPRLIGTLDRRTMSCLVELIFTLSCWSQTRQVTKFVFILLFFTVDLVILCDYQAYGGLFEFYQNTRFSVPSGYKV